MPSTAYPNMLTTRYAGSSRRVFDDIEIDVNTLLKARFGRIGPTCMGPDPVYASTVTPPTVFNYLYFIDFDIRQIRCIDTSAINGQGCKLVGPPLPSWLETSDIVSIVVTRGGTIMISRNSDARLTVLPGNYDIISSSTNGFDRPFGITRLPINVGEWTFVVWNAVGANDCRLLGNLAVTPDGTSVVGVVPGGILVSPGPNSSGPVTPYATIHYLISGFISTIAGGLGLPVYYTTENGAINSITNIYESTWAPVQITGSGPGQPTFYSGEVAITSQISNIANMSVDINTGNLWFQSFGDLTVIPNINNKLNDMLTLNAGCVYTVEKALAVDSLYIDGLTRKGITTNTSLSQYGQVRFTPAGDLLSVMSVDSTGIPCAFVMTRLPYPEIQQLDFGAYNVSGSLENYVPTTITPTITPGRTLGGANGKQTIAFQIRNLLNKNGFFFLGFPKNIILPSGVRSIIASNFRIESFIIVRDSQLLALTYDSNGAPLIRIPIQGIYGDNFSYLTTTESVMSIDIDTSEEISDIKSSTGNLSAILTLNPPNSLVSKLTPVLPYVHDIVQMVFDGYNNLYFAEKHSVSRIDVSTNSITLIAGNEFSTATAVSGDGGLATAAYITNIGGIAVSQTTLFISDTTDNVIRAVDISVPNGNITKYSGAAYGATTIFNGPTHLALDLSGNLIVCNTGKSRIDKLVNDAGTITISQVVSSPAIAYSGIAFDFFGNVYYNARTDATKTVYRRDSIYANVASIAGAGNGGISAGKGYLTGLSVTSSGGTATYKFSTFTDPGALPSKVSIAGFSNNNFNGIVTVLTQGFVGNLSEYRFTVANANITTILTGGTAEYISAIAVADTATHTVNSLNFTDSTFTRVVGNTTAGKSIPSGMLPATSISLNTPSCVLVTPGGSFIIGDAGNYRIVQSIGYNDTTLFPYVPPTRQQFSISQKSSIGLDTSSFFLVNSRVANNGSNCQAQYNYLNAYMYTLIVDSKLNRNNTDPSILGIIGNASLSGLSVYSRMGFISYLNNLLSGLNGPTGPFTGTMTAGLDSTKKKLQLTYVYGDGSSVMPPNLTPSPPISILVPTNSVNGIFSQYSPIPTNIGSIHHIAADSTGENIYLADCDNNRVVKLNITTGTQTVVGEGFSRPKGVAFHSDTQTLYVADTGNGQIVRINVDTGTQLTLATGFSNPTGIAVDNSRNIYVVESGTNSIIFVEVYTNNKTLFLYGLESPSGIAVVSHPTISSQPTLYVTNGYPLNRVDMYILDLTRLSRVQFDPGRNSIASGLTNPYGVAGDLYGNVYITNTGSNRVIRCTPAIGAVTIIQVGTFAPTGITCDSDGNIYYGDSTRNRIMRIPTDPGANAVSTVVSLGLVSRPRGIVKDSSGNIYVTSYSVPPQIIKITPTGQQSIYASTNHSGNAFSDLGDIAIDHLGNLYITDPAVNNVYKIAVNTRIVTLVTSYAQAGAIGVDSTGTKLYVAGFNNSISEYDGNQVTISFYNIYEFNMANGQSRILLNGLVSIYSTLIQIKLDMYDRVYVCHSSQYFGKFYVGGPNRANRFVRYVFGKTGITRIIPSTGVSQLVLYLPGNTEGWQTRSIGLYDPGPFGAAYMPPAKERIISSFTINQTGTLANYCTNASTKLYQIPLFSGQESRFPGISPVVELGILGSSGMVFDSETLNLYISDRDNNRITKLFLQDSKFTNIVCTNSYAGIYCGYSANAAQLLGITEVNNWKGDTQAALCVSSDMTPTDSGTPGPGRYTYKVTAPYKLLPFLN